MEPKRPAIVDRSLTLIDGFLWPRGPATSRLARPVAYGFALTFGSCVGQSFFISLFVPALLLATSLNPGELASIYSTATLVAAVLLPMAGRATDRLDVVACGLAAAIGTMAACLLMAIAYSPMTAFAAMALLRLFGQGLLPHVAMTALARFAADHRGKAIAIASLGYCAAEATLPLLVMWLVDSVSWRFAYAGLGLLIGLIIIPQASLLVRSNKTFRSVPEKAAASAMPIAGNRSLLHSSSFWCQLPIIALPSFAMTGLLFLQTLIAEEKDISMVDFAAGYFGYALIQIPSSILIGAMVDRFGSRNALIFHLVPLAIGAALLASFDHIHAAWAFLTMSGITTAASAILRTTVVAELVPAAELGAARSSLASILVVAAAAGPATFGWLLELGLGVNALLWITSAACVVAILPILCVAIALRMLPAAVRC